MCIDRWIVHHNRMCATSHMHWMCTSSLITIPQSLSPTSTSSSCCEMSLPTSMPMPCELGDDSPRTMMNNIELVCNICTSTAKKKSSTHSHRMRNNKEEKHIVPLHWRPLILSFSKWSGNNTCSQSWEEVFVCNTPIQHATVSQILCFRLILSIPPRMRRTLLGNEAEPSMPWGRWAEGNTGKVCDRHKWRENSHPLEGLGKTHLTCRGIHLHAIELLLCLSGIRSFSFFHAMALSVMEESYPSPQLHHLRHAQDWPSNRCLRPTPPRGIAQPMHEYSRERGRRSCTCGKGIVCNWFAMPEWPRILEHPRDPECHL